MRFPNRWYMVYNKRLIEELTEPPAFKRWSVPLTDKHPEVGAYWEFKRNCGWGPEDFSSGSGVLAWFKCPEGKDHIYQTQIKKWATAQQTSTRGCPYCQNRTLTPFAVTAGSQTVVWWQCATAPDHEWQQSVKQRVGRLCPYCTSRRIAPSGSLGELFPNIAKDFHKIKNGTLTPLELGPYSGRKVWWQCSKFSDHVWQATVNARTASGSSCPHCYRNNQ